MRSDDAFIERFRAGDPAAFEAVVRDHREAVYAVARRLLGDHADADEATQETFVRAWRAARTFRHDATLRTWLVSIALNVGRSILAARRAGGEPETEALVDARPGADLWVVRREAARGVRRAIASLPPRQREVVVLKVLSEMTYDEVAAAMSLSVGAVKAHLHQAVANLRRRLEAEGEA